MAKKPPLNEVVKAFSLNKTQDEWVKRGTIGDVHEENSSVHRRNNESTIDSTRANTNMLTSEHIEKPTKLVYFSARIPLEVRNAIRSVSVHRKNLGLSPASEQDITKAALIEWLDRNKQV